MDFFKNLAVLNLHADPASSGCYGPTIVSVVLVYFSPLLPSYHSYYSHIVNLSVHLSNIDLEKVFQSSTVSPSSLEV